MGSQTEQVLRTTDVELHKNVLDKIRFCQNLNVLEITKVLHLREQTFTESKCI